MDKTQWCVRQYKKTTCMEHIKSAAILMIELAFKLENKRAAIDLTRFAHVTAATEDFGQVQDQPLPNPAINSGQGTSNSTNVR